MGTYTTEEHQKVQKQWQERFNNWKKSGLSGKAWCKEHQVNYAQFCYWKRRLLQDHRLLQDTFIEVKDSSVKAGIEIICDKVSIRLSKDFDSATLRDCLRVLRNL